MSTNLLDRIHFSAGWSIEIYISKDKFDEDYYTVFIYGTRGGYRDRFHLRAEDIANLTSRLGGLIATALGGVPCESCALADGCIVQPFTEECEKLLADELIEASIGPMIEQCRQA